MKRFISIFMILTLVLFAFSACHTDISDNGDIAQSSKNPAGTDPVDGSNESWFADYYRIGWRKNSVDEAIIIRSVEEFRTYISGIVPDSVTSRFREEVVDNTAKYSDDFFNRHSLLVVLVPGGSGSVRHKVTAVTAENGVLRADIDRHNPEMCTSDMAYWQIFIETGVMSAGLNPKVEWNDIPLDSAALSPPVSELKSVALENSQEAGMLYAVFHFSGVHSRLYPGTFGIRKMTLDGKELDSGGFGVHGDEYEYYKRVIENGETAFYVPINMYPEFPAGIYQFSCEYQGKTFSTAPLNITG